MATFFLVKKKLRQCKELSVYYTKLANENEVKAKSIESFCFEMKSGNQISDYKHINILKDHVDNFNRGGVKRRTVK